MLDRATVTDSDTTDYVGGRVLVDITGGRTTGDQLGILNRLGVSLTSDLDRKFD